MFRKPPDATTVLTLYLAFLILLPARWVLPGLGAVGTPASMGSLCLIGWWALSRGRGHKEGRRYAYHMWTVLFLLFLVVSLTVTLSFTRALTGLESSATTRGFIAFMGYLGVALVCIDGIPTVERLVVLLNRLVNMVTVMAAIGIIQYFTPIDPVEWIWIPGLSLNSPLSGVGSRSDLARIIGTMLHPIEFAAVLSVTIPIALHFALFPMREGRWNIGRLAIIGLAIPLSISRTAFLILAFIGLMLWTTWDWRRRINLLGIAAGFLVMVRVAAPGVLGTIRSLFLNAGDDPSVEGRTDDFAIMSAYIRERPWFGRGYDTFIPAEYFFVDNQILLILVSSGIVGLTAMTLVAVASTISARQVYWHGPDPSTRHLGAVLAASFVGTCAGFVTYDALQFPTQAGVFYLLVGLCGGLWRLTVADSGRTYNNERSFPTVIEPNSLPRGSGGTPQPGQLPSGQERRTTHELSGG